MTRTLRHWLAGVTLTALAGGVTLAQPQIPRGEPQPLQQPDRQDDGVEVLARGTVHEAFATTAEYPTGGGPVIAKAPPDAIEELPPDQKPDGDNVQWIPGYWSYDGERKDYIWISGFWRVSPPGRVWVPGSWREVRGGFQYVSGFWNAITPKQVQAEIEYLPQPEPLLEQAPQIPAPTATSFYVPGNWSWRGNRYAWRAGYWVEHRSNWVWIPDQFRWTPAGYIHVAGYWDYVPENRGILFAPVYFRPAVYEQRGFVYTPTYVVSSNYFFGALFVRRGYSNYYFGDYFEERYATAGYTSWCAPAVRGTNFAINISIGRTVPYDPLWSYYSIQHRDDARWQRSVSDGYVGRYNGDLARPPRTLVQQATVVNSNNTNITNTNVNNITNITNITNVTTVKNPPPLMLSTLADVKTTNTNLTMKAVSREARVQEQKHAREIVQVSADRQKQETALVARNAATPVKSSDPPRTLKLDVPKIATVRAQAPEQQAPPAIPTTTPQKPEVKVVDPKAPKPTPPIITPMPVKPPVVDPNKPKPPVVDPPKPPVVDPNKPKPPVVDPPKPPVVDPNKPKPPVVDPPKPPVVDPPKPKPPVVDPPKPKPPVVDPPKPKPPVVVPPTPPVVVPPKPPVVVPPLPPVVVPPKPPVTPPLPPVVVPPKPPIPAPVPPPVQPVFAAPRPLPPVAAPPKPPIPAPVPLPVQPVFAAPRPLPPVAAPPKPPIPAPVPPPVQPVFTAPRPVPPMPAPMPPMKPADKPKDKANGNGKSK